jgi:ABC-type Mn2+/Zn2+ transport system permease subunit
MDLLREIFAPDFLLRNSVYTSLLIGLVCPLVGVYLVLRRLVFLGIALPQISSTGIALAMSLHVWYGDELDVFHGTEEHTLALVGAVVFALAAITVFALLERRRGAFTEGRLGTAYVVAAAASILLLSECPQAERHWLEIFKGEIIAISNASLLGTLVTFALVLTLLGLFRKEFLLVSYDRDMAVTLGKAVGAWDLGLYLLIGLTIAAAVLTVGPLVAFGFLVIPPLIVRPWVRNMRSFAFGSAALGVVTALTGFSLAYRHDLPVGPTDVALLGAAYVASFLLRKLPGLRRDTGPETARGGRV